MAKTTTTETQTDETPIKKVLSRQDQRNLEKVIDGDFRNVQDDITAAYESHMKGVREQIDAEYAELDANAQVIHDEVAALQEKFQKEWAEKLADLTARGYEPTAGRRGDGRLRVPAYLDLPLNWQGAGKQEKLDKAGRDAQYAHDMARHNLQRARAEAMRKVYIAGIAGTTAIELLNSIPTAQDAFAAALPKPEVKAVEA